jgi:cysteine desulfurase/selenocysteine lyase
MTTSNFTENPTASVVDLSAFQPESILSSLPGDHPRMAAALAVGRKAAQNGALDVDGLTRMVNELYAEGFPSKSPFASEPESLATNSLDIHDVPTPAILPENFSDHSAIGNAHAVYLQHMTNQPGQPEINESLANSRTPQHTELSHSISEVNIHSAPSPFSHEIDQRPVTPAPAAKSTDAEYYFLDGFRSELISPQSKEIRSSAHPPFDANLVRKDFPILRELVNGRPLIWFDNAATTQKPQVVIDRLSYFYRHENSNIHRAAHELAARATGAYEEARETVRRFINAPSVDTIVFVRGTTEAINLVAKSWGKKHLGEGDEILISHLEHHANIVPWQQLCQETGAKLKVAPVDDHGQIILEAYQNLLTPRTKLVALTQVSNALGTVTPARDMIQMAHRIGAKVLLDGAQSVPHMCVDMQALDPDFFVFSGHKVFGPTGIGVLYGRSDVLEDMPTWQGGGNMIQDVTFEKTVYYPAPAKFEAGTGNIADAIGLGAALEYIERIGIDNIAHYEHELLIYATHAMQTVPGLKFIGTAREKASVLSFTLDGYKSEEVGAALNQEGVAVRSGHHCAQPILRRFGLETTVRPSLAFYNTYAEIDVMVNVLQHLSIANV